MIGTVTLNPSTDICYNLKNFYRNGLFRTAAPVRTPGGKGVNVTRVINCLGEKVIATGFLGGSGGHFIKKRLQDIGIEEQFVEIEGEVRSCLSIIDEDGGQTEILEQGPHIHPEELERFEKVYHRILEKCSVVCASGSLPLGLSSSYYVRLADIAQSKNVKFILDTSGAALKDSICAKPFLIKPNREELSQLTGRAIECKEQAIRALLDFKDMKMEAIVVSLGNEGALLLYNNEIYEAAIPQIEAVNPVGSGDSMIGGIACGIHRGLALPEALKLGAACGTANALSERIAEIDRKILNSIYNEIRVTKING